MQESLLEQCSVLSFESGSSARVNDFSCNDTRPVMCESEQTSGTLKLGPAGSSDIVVKDSYLPYVYMYIYAPSSFSEVCTTYELVYPESLLPGERICTENGFYSGCFSMMETLSSNQRLVKYR